MPVVWKLKKWLAVERDIYRASELQALLASKAGVQLSLQAVSALINGKPNALRLQTIQAVCNALDCQLSDFCEVLPDPIEDKKKKTQTKVTSPERLYGGKKTALSNESIFPDPHEFTNNG